MIPDLLTYLLTSATIFPANHVTGAKTSLPGQSLHLAATSKTNTCKTKLQPSDNTDKH